MKERTTSAPPELQAAVRARLLKTRAAGHSARQIAAAAGLADTVIFRFAGQRSPYSISMPTAEKITAALDKLGAAPRPPPGPAPTPPTLPKPPNAPRKVRFSSISKAEADALRPLVRKAFDDAKAKAMSIGAVRNFKKPVLNRLGMSDGTHRQFLLMGLGMQHVTAEKVWRGLGLSRPAEFAKEAARATPSSTTAPKPKKASAQKELSFKDWQPDPPLPRKLPPDLGQEIKRFINYAIDRHQACTLDDLCRAASYNRQGLRTILAAGAGRPFRPDNARRLLAYIEKRTLKAAPGVARDARALLRRLEGLGALGDTYSIHASAPGVAPSAEPKYRHNAKTIKARDVLRDALAKRFGGNLPALAKFMGVLTSRMERLINGGMMRDGEADEIMAKLGGNGAPPVAMTLAVNALAEHTPHAAPEFGALEGAGAEEAASKLVASWSRQALDLILALAAKNRLP